MWDRVETLGPGIGYHPNARKSVLIVKPEHDDRAVETFAGTDIVVTKDGQKHLGAAIGTDEFKKKFVNEKVHEWVKEIMTVKHC